VQVEAGTTGSQSCSCTTEHRCTVRLLASSTACALCLLVQPGALLGNSTWLCTPSPGRAVLASTGQRSTEHTDTGLWLIELRKHLTPVDDNCHSLKVRVWQAPTVGSCSHTPSHYYDTITLRVSDFGTMEFVHTGPVPCSDRRSKYRKLVQSAGRARHVDIEVLQARIKLKQSRLEACKQRSAEERAG
jgi:hypothetical protein